jgi:hypothetical protein
MTVAGCAQDTTAAITASAAHLGVETGNDWLEGHTPAFCDYPFTDADAEFADHLNTVAAVQPRLAVAPDIERGRTLAQVTTQADRLVDHADTVVVVPKTVHPERVPGRFRIGVPTADYGSGAPWSVWHYRDCGPVHLLGGGPARQLTVGAHLPVASLDTSALGKLCKFGYWDGGTCDAPESWDYCRRLRTSLDNYVAAWGDVGD